MALISRIKEATLHIIRAISVIRGFPYTGPP
jgi:hypothetical protein